MLLCREEECEEQDEDVKKRTGRGGGGDERADDDSWLDRKRGTRTRSLTWRNNSAGGFCASKRLSRVVGPREIVMDERVGGRGDTAKPNPVIPDRV